MSLQYVVLKQQNANTKENISTTTTTLHPSSLLALDHLEKSLDSILPVTQEAVEKRWVVATLVYKGKNLRWKSSVDFGETSGGDGVTTPRNKLKQTGVEW